MSSRDGTSSDTTEPVKRYPMTPDSRSSRIEQSPHRNWLIPANFTNGHLWNSPVLQAHQYHFQDRLILFRYFFCVTILGNHIAIFLFPEILRPKGNFGIDLIDRNRPFCLILVNLPMCR